MEKEQVFFFALLSYVAGILTGSFGMTGTPYLLLAAAVLLSLSLVFRVKAALFFVVFVGVFGIGASQVSIRSDEYQKLAVAPAPVVGVVRVVHDPEERDFYRRTIVRYIECERQFCPTVAVLWQAPLGSRFEAGDTLSFQCALELPKNFDSDFDYRMYLAKEGIGYLCLEAKTTLLPSDAIGRAMRSFYQPKHMLEHALSQVLSEPEAGLAKGLLLGGDGYLPQALKESFTRIGLSHMIAVSGYNITIIAELLLALGLSLGLWRRHAIWTALIGIVCFIIMIGMPASAARAGAMASVVFIALQTGRLAQPARALLLAGALMLLHNPLLFRYDLGFQLSFLATLGILFIAPYQERLCPKRMVLKQISEVVLMTLSVEVFVLPVILLSFQTFSPLVIIGNFLVLLVPFAMATAFGAALLYLFWPGMHIFLGAFAYGLLTIMTRSVEWLGSLSGTSITVAQFGITAFLVWYLGLFLCILVVGRIFPRYTYESRV